jgi:hypothetical protein
MGVYKNVGCACKEMDCVQRDGLYVKRRTVCKEIDCVLKFDYLAILEYVAWKAGIIIGAWRFYILSSLVLYHSMALRVACAYLEVAKACINMCIIKNHYIH